MPITAIHPGEHLAEELDELGMSAAELARQLKVPTNRITEILNGQRAITGDTALRLGHFFGTSPEFWLNLQSLYELRLAEREPDWTKVAGSNTSGLLSLPGIGDDDRCQVRLNFFVGYPLEEAFGISGCSRDVIEEDVGVNQARRIRRKQLNIH